MGFDFFFYLGGGLVGVSHALDGGGGRGGGVGFVRRGGGRVEGME